MRQVTELVVRVADLVEAEGRILRVAAVRLAFGFGAIALAVGAIGGGITLLLGALYTVTADRAGVSVSALLTGAVAILIGGGLAWLGYRIGR